MFFIKENRGILSKSCFPQPSCMHKDFSKWDVPTMSKKAQSVNRSRSLWWPSVKSSLTKKKKKGTNTESRREDFMWDLKKHRSNTGRVKAQCYFSIFSTSIFSLYGVTIPENFGKAQVCLSWLWYEILLRKDAEKQNTQSCDHGVLQVQQQHPGLTSKLRATALNLPVSERWSALCECT